MTAARVSVVIVTWNSAETIEACLGSLKSAARDVPVEVVVVDNASSDDTVARVRSVAPEATVIANRDNRGLAAANNQGIVAATSDHILISNPDVEFGSGMVDELVAAIEQHPRRGMVFPALLHEDGRVQTTVGDLPTLREALAGRQAAARRRGGGDSGFWWYGFDHDIEREIGRGVEACYLIRRAAIAEVGLQDERYFLDWEGIDWADRFRRAGWHLWFTPRATAVHAGGVSIRRAPFRWIVRSHRGLYRYFADRRPRLRPILAVVVAARAGVKVVLQAAGRPMYAQGHDPRRASSPR